MKIILTGTQAYNWVLPIFGHLFEKYWGEPFLYIGDTPPPQLPNNVTFQPLQTFKEGIWPWDHWFGQGLREICQQFSGEIIALFLLDHWLNQPVDIDGVYQLAEYMRLNRQIIRGNLTTNGIWTNSKSIDTYGRLEILYIPPWDKNNSLNGGITFCPSLWNTDLLDKLIEPAWSLWDCEKLGTERLVKNPKIYAIGTRPYLLSRTHAMFHKDPHRISLENMQPDDRQFVMDRLPDGYRITDI